MRALLASPLGFFVGLSLGALGGGGSILAVPALVYGVGEPAQAATGTSLLVVGFAALVGIIPHWRKGHVRFGAGLLFGAAGIGGSVLGTTLNRGVDEDVLLVAFSVFMLIAGAAMWRRSRRPVALAPGADPGDAPSGRPVESSTGTSVTPKAAAGNTAKVAAGTNGTATILPTATQNVASTAVGRTAVRVDPRTAVKVVLAGSVVGALTGFFGVGGGFVIVPALVLSLGFAMNEAVGTSLVVIAINSAVALALRSGQSDIDWGAATPFLITAVLGTIVGGRLAERVDSRRLTTAFVALLVVVAGYTGISAVFALTGS